MLCSWALGCGSSVQGCCYWGSAQVKIMGGFKTDRRTTVFFKGLGKKSGYDFPKIVHQYLLKRLQGLPNTFTKLTMLKR